MNHQRQSNGLEIFQLWVQKERIQTNRYGAVHANLQISIPFRNQTDHVCWCTCSSGFDSFCSDKTLKENKQVRERLTFSESRWPSYQRKLSELGANSKNKLKFMINWSRLFSPVLLKFIFSTVFNSQEQLTNIQSLQHLALTWRVGVGGVGLTPPTFFGRTGFPLKWSLITLGRDLNKPVIAYTHKCLLLMSYAWKVL